VDAPDRRESLDVEPIPIRRDRRRRSDPLVVGVIVVLLGLGLAIAKPWSDERALDGIADGTATVPPSAVPDPPSTTATGGFDPLDPDAAAGLVDVIGTPDAWGVVTVTFGRDGRNVVWQSAITTEGGPVAPLIVIGTLPVHVLGVTAPADETPLGIRVWGRGHDGQWHWLDIGRIVPVVPAADLLLPPPRVDGVALLAWPPGRYRIDLLMGQHVSRIDVTIDRDAPPPDAPVSAWSTTGPRSTAIWTGDEPSGPYVVADGYVQPLDGLEGPTLSAAEAWLGGHTVVSAWSPRATALGVVLPSAALDATAVIRRVTPEEVFAGPVATIGTRPGASGVSTYVQFDMREPYRFEPGVYAIEAHWSGGEGADAGTWHIELRPAPADPVTTFLAAAQRYAPVAGSWGLVIGGAGADDSPVAVASLEDGVGCDDAVSPAQVLVIGITHPPDVDPGEIDFSRVRGGSGTEPVALRIARSVVPGLTLIGGRSAWALAEGTYVLTLEHEGERRTIDLCVGPG
jgi:hypothetical protein